MRKVTTEQFYAAIGPLNVAGSIQPGPWPYTVIFKLQTGSQQVVGKSVDRLENPARVVTDYYLADERP